MKNDLTCAVARDLMPSCADGLASEETLDAVYRHTETCEACRNEYAKMKKPLPTENAAEDAKMVDFMKKIQLSELKKAVISNVVIGILGLCLLLGVIWGVLRFHYNYTPITAADYDTVTQNVYTGTDGGATLEFIGVLRDGTMTAEDYKTEYDKKTGRLTFTMYKHKADRTDPQEFAISYRIPEPVSSIYLNDVPLWEDGVSVTAAAVRAFDAAHPYMGDMSLNQKSASALEITGECGLYSNELTTSARPYTWTLIFLEDRFVDHMMEDQVLLLATIGNLDAVCFRFPAADETGEGAREVTLTVEQANSLTGLDVKEAGKTPAGVQKLIDACRDLMRYTSSSSVAPEDRK